MDVTMCVPGISLSLVLSLHNTRASLYLHTITITTITTIAICVVSRSSRCRMKLSRLLLSTLHQCQQSTLWYGLGWYFCWIAALSCARCRQIFHLFVVLLASWFLTIGVAGSFSEGGQPFHPAKIQSFPANIFSCQGGPSSSILSCQVTVLSCSAKLFYQ